MRGIYILSITLIEDRMNTFYYNCFYTPYFSPVYFNLSFANNPDPVEKINPQPPQKQQKQKVGKIRRSKSKLNVRNIIPNISKKLINFLCSQECLKILKHMNPNIVSTQVSKFLAIIKNTKEQLKSYIGLNDLTVLWAGSKNGQDENIYRLIRILSNIYLNQHSARSLILSSRIKPELKRKHLKYRRKILFYLKNSLQMSSFKKKDLP